MDVIAQGHSVHVDVDGSGPPALFLHGVPDTAAIWAPVIAGVKDRYTCYAPDFQGIHRSAANPAFDYSLDGYADWVEAVVTALGITAPITLVVHDWGGPIGLAWAVKYPQRLARIVAINTPFSSEYRWHTWARIWRLPLIGELVMALTTRGLFHREIRRGSRRLDRAHIDAMWAGAPSKAGSRRTTLKLYRSLDPAKLGDREAALHAVAKRVPITVLWGRADPYIPLRFATMFPTADVTVVDDCGHWLPAESPETVVAALHR